jgi:hypothetical protein
MSNEQLKHIFDNSTCLTKKQLKSYVSGGMTNEEAYAVEVHLNSCPLCSDAVDGMFAQQESNLVTTNDINGDFLKDHFGNINPQIHLNSITSTHSKQIDLQKKKEKVHHLWRTASVAAGLLLLAGTLWYYRFLQVETGMQQIAQELPLPPQTELKAAEQQQPIAMNRVVTEDALMAKPVNEPQPVQRAETGKDDMAEAVIAKQPAVPVDPKKQKEAPEDAVVDGYKAPLIKEDERKVLSKEEIEKKPARITQSIAAAPATSGQTSFGNSYNADITNVTEKSAEKKAVRESVQAIDKIEQANKLYQTRQYNDALNIYLKEINGPASDNNRKNEARLGAARCYIATGNKEKAKALLMIVFADGGKRKREAKRLLKEIE